MSGRPSSFRSTTAKLKPTSRSRLPGMTVVCAYCGNGTAGRMDRVLAKATVVVSARVDMARADFVFPMIGSVNMASDAFPIVAPARQLDFPAWQNQPAAVVEG